MALGALMYWNTSTTGRASQAAWVESKAAADTCWPAVTSIMQHLGFGRPTATDAATDRAGVDFTTSDGRRWAWRNRGASYFSYGDVTIRVSRPSGAVTEADKLRRGCVDRLLWTWTTAGGCTQQWLVLDASRVAGLLDKQWPRLQMADAEAACVPFKALAEAGAIVASSRGVVRALQ